METVAGLGVKSVRASKKFDLILTRFLGILENRFKSEFRYMPFVAEHPDWKLIHSLLFRNQPVTLNGDCYFPIFIEGDLLGAIRHPSSTLHTLDQTKISELVNLILGESLTSIYKSEGIQRLEENMGSSTAPSGVVRLAEFKKTRVQMRPSLLTSPDQLMSASSSRMLSTPTLIEASNIDEAFKLALEVHEEGKRLAMINYWDLAAEVRADAKALTELGEISIFLPNLHLLNSQEQEALKKHFRHAFNEEIAPEERPLWLSATTLAYPDLLKHRDLDQQMLKFLSMSFLRIQKSFEKNLGAGPQSDLH